MRAMVAGAAIGVVVLAGCAKDDAADLKKQLTDSGMTAEQSDCIVSGLQSRGVALAQYDEPSAEDSAKITEAVTECMLAGTGVTVPTTP